ncbi:hypothetical protein I316_01289 [Kwoniella heveanensis BCC8398]|uniref:Uncharacterized protein n=1 Tax=Kwoniella heveanensis BCC8398 TaxID=1296120 RepID=A0A1B9H090_9TREE|nr:hypothetical protein I316_01289 [Kwoniella heveanensis BCC8398]
MQMHSCIDLSTLVADDISTTPALNATATVTSHRRRHSQKDKHKERRRRDRKVYESPPVIAERESSLYLPSPPQYEYPFDNQYPFGSGSGSAGPNAVHSPSIYLPVPVTYDLPSFLFFLDGKQRRRRRRQA